MPTASSLNTLTHEVVTYNLGVPTSSVATILDALYTAVGSLATNIWTATKRQNTGTTEAIQLDPPAGSVRQYDRILVAGAAAGVHGSTLMISPETFGTNKLFIGLFPAATSAPTYSAWDSATPFTAGVGGTIRNVGYTMALNSGVTVVSIIIMASAESFLIGFASATQIYWCGAGAIGDAGVISSSWAESDGALYGLFWSKDIPANMFSSFNGAYYHSNSSGDAHFYFVNGGLTSTYATTTRASNSGQVWVTDDDFMRDPDGNAALQAVHVMNNTTANYRGRVRNVSVGPRVNSSARRITAGSSIYAPIWGGTSGSLHDAFWVKVVA